MRFFNRQGWTLLLATAVVLGVGCVSNGADKPAALVGHWVFVDGYRSSKVPEKSVELFSDGAGVVDGLSLTWRVDNKRLSLLTSSVGISADYKVSGYELTLVYDGGDSAVFVKKDKLEEYKFEKLSTYFTDSRDGQKYRAVKIGGKSWMAQNLNHKTGNSWCYEGNDANCKQYGRLYDWNTAKSVCHAGWHLPSKAEWDALENAAGGNVADKKLKSTSGWNNNGSGTDEFGFSALPGGCRDTDGSFNSAGNDGYWWTATEDGSGDAYGRDMYYNGDYVYEGRRDKDYGFSVRCVRDN
jgi:uncharacterized protein (TIGR02145 family)